MCSQVEKVCMRLPWLVEPYVCLLAGIRVLRPVASAVKIRGCGFLGSLVPNMLPSLQGRRNRLVAFDQDGHELLGKLLVLLCEIRVRGTRRAGASCATNAMDVVFNSKRPLVVDHESDILDVPSAGGYICRNDDGRPSRPEVCKNTISVLLLFISMNASHFPAFRLQLPVDVVALLLVQHEDQNLRIVLEQLRQQGQQFALFFRALRRLPPLAKPCGWQPTEQCGHCRC